MRLLLDQNLSPRLVAALADLYPGSTHVREVSLAAAYDDAVWRYAAEHGLTILALLRDQYEAIARFEAEDEAAFMALG